MSSCEFCRQAQCSCIQLSLDGKILATTSSKYLGVQITDIVSWDLHVNSITSTARQRLGMIKKVLFDAPKKFKKLLMLHSADSFKNMLVKWGTPFWLNIYLGQIEMVQRRAVRFIGNLRGREGTPLRGKHLVWSFCRIEEWMQESNFYLKYCRVFTHSPFNFNNITAQQTALCSLVTRSVASSKPLTMTATKQVSLNSF